MSLESRRQKAYNTIQETTLQGLQHPEVIARLGNYAHALSEMVATSFCIPREGDAALLPADQMGQDTVGILPLVWREKTMPTFGAFGDTETAVTSLTDANMDAMVNLYSDIADTELGRQAVIPNHPYIITHNLHRRRAARITAGIAHELDHLRQHRAYVRSQPATLLHGKSAPDQPRCVVLERSAYQITGDILAAHGQNVAKRVSIAKQIAKGSSPERAGYQLHTSATSPHISSLALSDLFGTGNPGEVTHDEVVAYRTAGLIDEGPAFATSESP